MTVAGGLLAEWSSLTALVDAHEQAAPAWAVRALTGTSIGFALLLGLTVAWLLDRYNQIRDAEATIQSCDNVTQTGDDIE